MLRRDDLMRAIKKLKVMGNGFGMIPVGGSYLVQSVPAELNMDHTVVLQLAEVRRCRRVNHSRCQDKSSQYAAVFETYCVSDRCSQRFK